MVFMKVGEEVFKKQTSQQRVDLIINGPILKTLIFLAVPSVLMALIQVIMPITDALFVNNISGTNVASAISYSQPALNAVIAMAQGLAVAAMAMIGQLQGKKEILKTKQLMRQFLFISLVLSIAAIPIVIAIALPISKNVTSEISNYVFTYISLYAFVFPFVFVDSIYVAIKNALGKPEDAFIRAIIMLILKIIFNFIFIFLFRLDIVGSVLASLFSEFILSFWIVYDLFFRKSEYQLSFKNFKIDFSIYRNIFKLSIPAMMNSVMLSIGFFLINLEVQKYGAVSINGLGIANNITNLAFILPSTIGSVVTTMISMNIGAKNVERSKKVLNAGMMICMIISIVSVSSVVFAAPYLTSLFTQRKDVLVIANDALNIYIYSVFAFGFVMVIQGTFIALGKTRLPLYAGIARIWLFRYLFILAFDHTLGLYAVFWGNLFSNYLTAIILIALIPKIKWQSNI